MDINEISFTTETSDDNAIQKNTIIKLQKDIIGMFQENSRLQRIISELSKTKVKISIDTQTDQKEQDIQLKQLKLGIVQANSELERVMTENRLLTMKVKMLPEMTKFQDQEELFEQIVEQSDCIREQVEKIDKLTLDLDEMSSKFQELQKVCERLTSDLKKEVTISQSLEKERFKLNLEVTQLRERLYQFELENQRLKDNYVDTELFLQEWRTKQNSLEDQNKQLIEELQTQSQCFIEEQNKTMELQAFIDQYRLDVIEYESIFNQKLETIRKFEEDVRKKDREMWEMSEALRIRDLDYSSNQIKIQNLLGDILEKDKVITQLKTNQKTQQLLLKEYSEEQVKLNETIEGLQQTNQDLREQLCDLKQRTKELDQLQEEQITKQQLLQQLNQARDENYNLNDMIEGLQEQLQICNQKRVLEEDIHTNIQAKLEEKIAEYERKERQHQIDTENFRSLLYEKNLKGPKHTSLDMTDVTLLKSALKNVVNKTTQTYMSDPINIRASEPEKKNKVIKTNSATQTIEEVTKAQNTNPSQEYLALKDQFTKLQKKHQEALENYYYFQTESKQLKTRLEQLEAQKKEPQNLRNNIEQPKPIFGELQRFHLDENPNFKDSQTNKQISKERSISNSKTNVSDDIQLDVTQTVEYKKLKEEIRTVQLEVEQLKQLIQMKDEMISQLQKERSLIQESITSLKQKLESSDDAIELRQVKEKLSQYQQEQQTLQERLKVLQSDLSQKTTECISLKNVNNFLHKDLERLRSQVG